MFKEVTLTVLLGFLIFQYVLGQSTTTSYWGFEAGQQTTTQNWWGENVDKGETESIQTASNPPASTSIPSVSVAAAGVLPVGEVPSSEADPLSVPNPSGNDTASLNSTILALRPFESMLLIPIASFLLIH